MFVIGITGGIGTGKSSAAALCAEAGLPVISADMVSRQVTEAGGAAMPAILEAFGPEYLDDSGALDRRKMSDLVFSDHAALATLNRILHKVILSKMGEEVERLSKQKVKAVVLDVPLPIKEGFLDISNTVWAVWADEEIRISRLIGRGMTPQEAARRIAVQMTREEYQKIADFEIDNNGSESDLREAVEKMLAQELGERGIPYKSLFAVEEALADDASPRH